jgi:xanthine/uracil permease
MQSEWFEENESRLPGEFDVKRLEPRTTRWRQFGMLGIGVVVLWAAHDIASWPRDASSMQVLVWTGSVTALAVGLVAAATIGFMDSVEHARARLFRWRHLLAWGLTDVVVGGALAALLVTRNPFGRLLAHGKITGSDVVDLGHLVAAGLCLVGALIALLAARDSFFDERRWHVHL